MSASAPVVRDRLWRCGPWSVQRRDDELAEVRWEGRRVLRSVRAVVRDPYWRTADLAVVSVGETAQELILRVRSRGFGSDLRGTLTARVSGNRLCVDWDAVSGTDLLTNRTGLVVLHPPEAAGAALRVRHPDGSVTTTAFPDEIAPHQPAEDIAGLTWTDDGLEIDVAFSGDVFEMEDQRNWTDASFKTYSRPLALPAPYRIATGERVAQSISVRVRERTGPGRPRPRDGIALSPGGAFPAVTTAASSTPEPPTGPVPPVGAELLVEVDLAEETWRSTLSRAARSGCALDLRFVLPEQGAAGLDDALRVLQGAPLVRAAAFRSDGPLAHLSDESATRALRDALARHGLRVPVLGGSRAHFTELNRGAELLAPGLEGIVFASTPLQHTDSDEQLVESVAMQRRTALQAARLAGDLPVRVGPVTLQPRFVDGERGSDLAPPPDDRIDSDWIAAWSIASAAALAVPGVEAVCWFEQWGPRGIRRDDGSARPVARALEALAAAAGAELLWGDSPDGRVWALGAAGPSGTTLFAASLDRDPRVVTVHWAGESVRLSLPPFGWTCRATGPAASARHPSS